MTSPRLFQDNEFKSTSHDNDFLNILFDPKDTKINPISKKIVERAGLSLMLLSLDEEKNIKLTKYRVGKKKIEGKDTGVLLNLNEKSSSVSQGLSLLSLSPSMSTEPLSPSSSTTGMLAPPSPMHIPGLLTSPAHHQKVELKP